MATARTPDAAALLDAWEAALCEPADLRGPSLLVSLGWLDSVETLARCTVGNTDCLLFALRDALFGSTLECLSMCASCAQTLEFTLSTADLVPAAWGSAAPCVELLDGLLQCRPPVNSDVSELAGAEHINSRRLLRQCLVAGGAPLEALSDRDCDQALGELAEADPGASIEITIECSCGHAWTEEFDIRTYLLAELTDWAARTLGDVHRLASRYGWSESAILRMSPWRKRIYLDACEGA